MTFFFFNASLEVNELGKCACVQTQEGHNLPSFLGDSMIVAFVAPSSLTLEAPHYPNVPSTVYSAICSLSTSAPEMRRSPSFTSLLSSLLHTDEENSPL